MGSKVESWSCPKTFNYTIYYLAMSFVYTPIKLHVMGWKHGKVCQKSSHTCSQSHIYGIKLKKIHSKLFKRSLWNNGALHWVYGKLHIQCKKKSYKKNGWKICSKLVGFSKFFNIFLYENFNKLCLWYEKILNTFIHINVLSIWKYKRSNYNYIFIIFSYIWSRSMTPTFLYLYF
jgi:hypothetical protein